MSKLILTIDNSRPQVTDVRRFVLDSSKIVGLIEDKWGYVGVQFKPAEIAVPTMAYVAESFDELAAKVLKDPNKIVVTINPRVQSSTLKRFVLDIRKIKGVVENSVGTQLTIKTSANAVPTVVYVTESFDEIASLVVDGPFDSEMD